MTSMALKYKDERGSCSSSSLRLCAPARDHFLSLSLTALAFRTPAHSEEGSRLHGVENATGFGLDTRPYVVNLAPLAMCMRKM